MSLQSSRMYSTSLRSLWGHSECKRLGSNPLLSLKLSLLALLTKKKEQKRKSKKEDFQVPIILFHPAWSVLRGRGFDTEKPPDCAGIKGS